MRAVRQRWAVILAIFAAVIPVPVLAERTAPEMDPDTEVAKRHFARGAELYDEGRYVEAVREFEEAKRLKPSAALDFNSARCHDRLGNWIEAADAYERYLAAALGAADAAEVRARIAVLRERAGLVASPAAQAEPRTRPAQPMPLVRRWWLWTAIGAVVVAGVAVGAGVGATQGAETPIPMTTDGNFSVRFP